MTSLKEIQEALTKAREYGGEFDNGFVVDRIFARVPTKAKTQHLVTLDESITTNKEIIVPLQYCEGGKKGRVNDALHTIYAAAWDRNICVYDCDEPGVTERLVQLMTQVMRDNGDKTTTHLLVPHVLEVPEEIGGVRIIKCDIDNSYLTDLLDAAHPSDRNRFVVALDLTHPGIFINPYNVGDTNIMGMAVLNPEFTCLGAI